MDGEWEEYQRWLMPNSLTRYDFDMAPTIFREGGFRFFFFSREETRIHVSQPETVKRSSG